MDPFEKLKKITNIIPFKGLIRPLYLPLLKKVKHNYYTNNLNKSGAEVLIRASKVLDKAGVFHWLEFGTLLGIVRDGKLIKHDIDIDLGVFIEDFSDDIISSFEEAGFTYKHGFMIEDGSGREQTFSFHNINVDLFYFHKESNNLHCHIFGMNKDTTRFIRQINTISSGFKQIEFEQTLFNIPKDEKRRLIDTYGEDYTTPIKDWHTPTAALNSELINKQVVYL